MQANVLESIKGLILPVVEVEVKKAIEAKSDELIDVLLGKLAAAIPGQFDDAFIASLAPKLKVEAKAFLLEQAEKIS